MYVCTYVCMYVCMYVCVYVCVCVFVCMYVCMPWLCERSESSPMNGCECVTCCAVIVRQVSNAQHWLDFFCARDRLKCDWWCTHQFRHAPGAGHGCWCSSVLECWRATGTPASDSQRITIHHCMLPAQKLLIPSSIHHCILPVQRFLIPPSSRTAAELLGSGC